MGSLALTLVVFRYVCVLRECCCRKRVTMDDCGSDESGGKEAEAGAEAEDCVSCKEKKADFMALPCGCKVCDHLI